MRISVLIDISKAFASVDIIMKRNLVLTHDSVPATAVCTEAAS